MPANILDLFIERGLKPVKKTAKEWASPCPICGGTDRCNIWPDSQDGRGYFWCRQCGQKGDGIQFLRDVEGMSYWDACERMGVERAANLTAPSLHTEKAVEAFEAIPRTDLDADGVDVMKWRSKASAFVAWAHQHLLNTPSQLAWLAARGLDQTAVKKYRLGYCPGEKGKNCLIRPRSVWGLPPALKEDGKEKRLWLPRGIVIPQLVPDGDGVAVHRIRIRRLDKDREEFRPKHKYHVVEGSSMDVLCLPCSMPMHESGGLVVVTESELDAMLLHHVGGDIFHCVSSMTSNIRHLSHAAFDLMSEALCILVALDIDRAGADGWPRWQATFPRSKRWPVPSGKDPGEAFAQGEDLRLWLEAGIPPGVRMMMQETAEPVTAAAEAPEAAPEIPPDVLRFAEMWKGKPITYTHMKDENGNCTGWSWDYNRQWAKDHGEELQEFLRFENQSPDVWEWLSVNPAEKITSQNFLYFEY